MNQGSNEPDISSERSLPLLSEEHLPALPEQDIQLSESKKSLTGSKSSLSPFSDTEENGQHEQTADPSGRTVRGLVLGGGGAKGCYHVGAWEAFREMKMEFDAVTGTSIGALVGAFYVQQDLAPVVDFVIGMKPTEIAEELPYLPNTMKEKVRGTKTVIEFLMKYMDDKMDITPLRRHFEDIFDYEKFSKSPIGYACMTYNDTLQEGQGFTKDEITAENAENVIMASAACYPAFPKVQIGDQIYMDGGYADNVPIELLLQIQPEADERVVIDIHNPQDPIPPAWRPDMKLIQPLINPGNSLDFSENHAMRLYNQGYLETMKYYDRLPGYLFTFTEDDWPLMQVVEKYLDTQMEQNQIVLPDSGQIENSALSALLGYVPFELNNRYAPEYHYGRLIEALALLARMEPVSLYSYKEFLIELTNRLQSLTLTKTNEADYKMVEVFSNLKREELPVLLHRLLVRNQGKFPSTVEKFRDRIPVSYALAYTWYFLEELTRNLQSDPEPDAD